MTWRKRRAIIIILLILFFVVLLWIARRPGHLSSNQILVMDVEGQIDEQSSFNFPGALVGETTPVLHDYLDAIDSAASDSRITGLVLRIAPLETGWSKLEEMRAHLLAFQKSGKPSICYLGYDGVGNPEYYLASACDKVWLVPTDPVNIKGLMAEALFFRGTLDKLKIVPQFFHTGPFKTATNMFTEKKFTPEHREEVQSLLGSIYGQYLSDTAQARHMDRAKFESFVTSGPLLPSEALQDGIVDRLAYWDQVQDYFKDRRGWNPVTLDRYRAFLSDDGIGADKVAVVYATGMIVSGESDTSPGGGFVMGGDSVASDIRSARQDSSIKAIILRVDSGGGSVVASEVIRREMELAREVKPVVVSMSDVAASGGYWISVPANKIVAEPNSITGSIGVLTGKLNISGLYNLLGMSTDYVATSDNATLFSEQQNFTPAQQAYMEKSIQDIYSQFTKGVSEGRGMPVKAVEAIAQGRVWSGTQAKTLGLVDELGGLDQAIEVAKDLAKIPASERVNLVRLPKEENFFEWLVKRDTNGVSESRWLESLERRLGSMSNTVQARIPYELHIR